MWNRFGRCRRARTTPCTGPLTAASLRYRSGRCRQGPLKANVRARSEAFPRIKKYRAAVSIICRMHVYEFNPDQDQSIVFLHGANSGGWMWEKVIAELREYHCIAIDLPGHAQSASLEWTTPEHVAAQIARIIHQTAHEGTAHIVGLSLGGYVGLKVLKENPDVVESILVSGVPSKPLPQRWLMYAMGWLIAPFIHTDRLLRISARVARVPDSDLESFVQYTKQNSKQAFRRINSQARSFVPPAEALTQEPRKMFVTGSFDQGAFLSALEELPLVSINACSYRAERCGHAWPAQRPELFAETVRAWINESSLPKDLTHVASS